VCDLAERYQAKVVNLEVPAGQGYSLEQLTAAVEQHKPAVLFVVQSLAGACGDSVGSLC
jgi:alanine-glyoxylate transaminase/serine-glyoxylate transaminase/serine-pyruvate transaminase